MKLAAAALLAIALPAQAQMYKCVDARGTTRYADAPGPGCKPVDIRASPPISGSLQRPQRKDLGFEEAEFRRRQAERAAAEADERKALVERCTQLRREHGLLRSGRQLVRIDEKGERQYLEDATRDRRLAELQRQLAACP